MLMARTQTLVQLNDDLLATLDGLSAREGRSRSDLIREAVERYVHDELEKVIDRNIVEGYTRIPPTDIWGDWPVRAAIAEEPW